jgi:hypothetical protein
VLWFFALLGLVIVVVIGLVVLGRETARLADHARPAVFDLTEAVDFIADRLPPDVQARLSHDDVHWVLMADADLLEEVAVDVAEDEPVDDSNDEVEVLVPDEAVARILAQADASGRELADEDVVAVLDGRFAYLQAIGAVGPEADDGA